MARRPRAHERGAIHHVWTRGIDGLDLFHDEQDRRDCLTRIADAVADSDAAWLCWVLMATHLHAVVRAGERPVSELMQRLKTGLAVRFNLRSERQGPVFQGRFGSRLVQGDEDFLNLLCYVHRNPLKAGVVTSISGLESYPWTSYGALVGRRPPHAFEAVSECLSLLDDTGTRARARLRDAMIRAGEHEQALRTGDESERVQRLIARACADVGLPESALTGGARDRRVSQLRSRICRAAVHELGVRPVAVARALGVTRAAVGFALRRQPPGGRF